MTPEKPAGVSRRPEGLADLEFCIELFEGAREKLLAMLPPDLRGVVLQQQYSAQARSYAETFPDAKYEIVEAGQERVGRMVIVEREETIHLVDISILPAWRGRGIGTKILRALQHDADMTSRLVALKVASDNYDALRLYERLGFMIVGSTDMCVSMRWSTKPS